MDAIDTFQTFGKSCEAAFANNFKIKTPLPVGYLKHEPTGSVIAVYKPISRFKALMLKWCFELKYVKI